MTATDGELLTVLYTSRAVSEFDEAQLDALLTQSRAANLGKDITGMLLYRGGRFVQVLEGPVEAVEGLLDRIRADARHSDVRVLLDERIGRRQFADWSMGFQRMEPATQAAPNGYRDTFDDLDDRDDLTVTTRAARELSLWFRVRAGETGAAAG